MIRGLRANGVDVIPVAARQHFSKGVVPPDDLHVNVVDVPPRGRSWHARVDMVRRPRSNLRRGAFAERMRECAAGADVMHLEETETAWAAVGSAIPSLVHIHYLTRRDRPLGSPFHKSFYSTLEFVLAERAAARHNVELVASSPLVAGRLRALAPRATVTLAPLTLDPAGYARASLEEPVAGIIGTGSWAPTAAAMRRLTSMVWPLVEARVPGASLQIAGRSTDRLGLRGAGIDVVGEVDSSSTFLQGIAVLLYPIARGSGMKVKVLEALACGIPVVTTPEGAEGIAASDGVVVETEDAALALAAVELLRDHEARQERGRAAHELFQKRYAPEVATAPLVDLYRRMAERG